MRAFILVALFGLFSITVSGCSVFGIRTTDEPDYEVTRSEGAFELRRYSSYVVAKTTVEKDYDGASSTAFRRLFRYISGANSGSRAIDMTAPVIREPRSGSGKEGKKIAMTAPVLMRESNLEETSDGWEMAFVLPEEYTFETAPVPSSPDVRLENVPEKTVAVLRFSGSFNDERFAEKRAEMLELLKGKGYRAISEPRLAGYDPPWTIPPLRRNEILVDVEAPGDAGEPTPVASDATIESASSARSET